MSNLVHIAGPSQSRIDFVYIDTDHPKLVGIVSRYVAAAVNNALDAVTLTSAPMLEGEVDGYLHTLIMSGPVLHDKRGFTTFYKATLYVLSSEFGLAEAIALQLKAVVLGVLFPYHVRELSRQYYSPTGILAAEHLM